MRGAVLVIGSLLWDDKNNRDAWRGEHLRVDAAIPVRVPIRYGRKSSKRSNTYTMTLFPGHPAGCGVLVPLQSALTSFDTLWTEAQALWNAESGNAAPGSIGAGWGCIGAMFRSTPDADETQQQWTRAFQERGTQVINPVRHDGILDIPWPTTLGSDDADVDVILANATREAEPAPTSRIVADAWCAQDAGEEKYFFENVRYGIRTIDDQPIWRQIKAKNPPWLKNGAYADVAALLDGQGC